MSKRKQEKKRSREKQKRKESNMTRKYSPSQGLVNRLTKRLESTAESDKEKRIAELIRQGKVSEAAREAGL